MIMFEYELSVALCRLMHSTLLFFKGRTKRSAI